MPNKGSDKGRSKHGSGARRIPAKTHTKTTAPTGESAKESGPPRLFAPSGSLRSTSSQESGPRRLYVSPTLQTHHAVSRGAAKAR
jgi:hypothetical protein